MKKFLLTPVLLIVLACANGFAQTKTEVITNANVVALTKAGLSESIIIRTIENSDTKFDTSTSAILALKKQGVTNGVISKMAGKTTANPAPANKPDGNLAAVKSLMHPYYFESSSKSYKPLEKGSAELKTKLKALGYGGSETNLELEGETSNTVFTKGSPISFVAYVGEGQTPILNLYKAEVKKGKRLGKLSSAKIFNKNNVSKYSIAINPVALNSSVYKLEVATELETGEYFFTGRSATGQIFEAFPFTVR
ncbi:hypothetical protein OQX63_17350 [Pedobacter sp. PF22-3]|uniref:hypothetical protein n=1 Tax=Pedobacter sp. PF22-3 TaxID=2994467 RepID=UPI002246B86A|nr:hypothetical protein [Pedobacter sp. PF22-3]MCX2495260.1 hypothetical protein [Pedobacter sp. PF22-3]